MPVSQSWLQPWHDFFLLVGGASATLLGLVFVAASIAATVPSEKLGPRETRALWVIPLIAAFGRGLLCCALALMPGQTPQSFGALVAGFAILDCLRWGQIAVGLRRHQQSIGDLESSDWWWHLIAPSVASLSLAGLGLWLAQGHEVALYGLAAAIMVHLSVGIHNAWELADYLAALT